MTGQTTAPSPVSDDVAGQYRREIEEKRAAAAHYECQRDYEMLAAASKIRADDARMERLRLWVRRQRTEIDTVLDSIGLK